MNVGLDKSNFRRDMVYRAENLAMNKPTFIAKIQVYFFSFLNNDYPLFYRTKPLQTIIYVLIYLSNLIQFNLITDKPSLIYV